jgi:hypothetical protein
MNRVANIIAMHSKDKLSWFFLPWIIVGSSFFINVAIAILVGGKSPIYTGGMSSIYIYMLIAGSLSVAGGFPFVLGFSGRRSDYFLGTTALAAVVSATWAVLLWMLSIIEGNIFPSWGLDLHFFHLPYLSDGSPAAQLWVFFVVMLFMFFLGFFPGSVYQRFGRSGMYVLFGISGVALTLLSFASTYWNWWPSIFNWFAHETALDLAWWMLPIIGVSALASYALLRKATV